MNINHIMTYGGDISRPERKRVGRGIGSGHGKTSGRGHKGAGSRSGTKRRLAFEGGQTPVFRRVAKRGMKTQGSAVSLVNLSDLVRHFGPNGTVTVADLQKAGLSRRAHAIKIVNGNGIMANGLSISGCNFSSSVSRSLGKS